MEVRRTLNMTVAEYLELENSSEEKFEFDNGQVWAMSGATPNHAIISSNLARVIGNLLDLEKCTMFSGDLRVSLESANAFYRPDATITCEEARYSEEDPNSLTNPQIIIEVLSPSTEGFDRGTKFQKYSLIPSLKEYILVSQDRPIIESFFRLDDNTWRMSRAVGLENSFTMQLLNLSAPLNEIYRGTRNLLAPYTD